MASYELPEVELPNNDLLLLRDAKAEAVLPELVDNGAKNLIRFYESASAGGGKSTLNPNGYSVTLSGSSSVTGMALGEILNPGSGTYVFKYVSTGTTGNAIVLYDYTTSSNFLIVSGSGSTEISNFDPTHRYGIHSYVGSAMTLNGTISAMICPKAAYDISQEFEPYAFSNPVLSPAVVRAANKGSGKNRLCFDLSALRAKNTYGTWTSSNVYERRGMRFTINPDMSITVVKIGDRDGDAWLDLYGDSDTTDFVGMICSGCPSGGKSGSTEYYSMQCGTNYNYGNPDEQTVTKGAIAIVIRAAYTSSTALTFKPMICTKNDWLMSREYVPYAMTNAELTAMVNPSVFAGNLTDTSVQSLTNGRIVGYASTVAGITGYVVVDTYVLNSTGTQVMQVAQFSTGARKTRLYNGSWQSWV